MVNSQCSFIAQKGLHPNITPAHLFNAKGTMGLALKGVYISTTHIETVDSDKHRESHKIIATEHKARKEMQQSWLSSFFCQQKWLHASKLLPCDNLQEPVPWSNSADHRAFAAVDAAPLPIKKNADDYKYAEEYEKWQLQPTQLNITNDARTDSLQNSTIPVFAANPSFISHEDLDKLKVITHFTQEDLTTVGIISMAESIYFARHNRLLHEHDIQPVQSNGLSLKQLALNFIKSPIWYEDGKLTEFLMDVSALTKALPKHSRAKRATATTFGLLAPLYDGVNKQMFFTSLFDLAVQGGENARIQYDQSFSASTKVEQAKDALRHAFNQKMQLIAAILFEKIIGAYALKDRLKEITTAEQRSPIETRLGNEISLIGDIIYFSYQSFYKNFIHSKALALNTLPDDDLDFLLQTVTKQASSAKSLQDKFAVPAALKAKYANAAEAFLQTKLEKIASQSSTVAPSLPSLTTHPLFTPAQNATVSPYSEQDLAHIANIVTKLKMAGHKGTEPQLNAKATHWYEKGGKTLAGLYLVNNMTNIIDPDQMVKSCTLENIGTNVVSVINPGFGIAIQFKGLVENIRDEVDDTVLSAEEKERVFDLLKQKVEEKFKTQGNNPDLSDLREALAILLSPQPDVQKLRELGIPIKTSEQKAVAVTKSIAGFVLPLVVPALGIITALYDLIQAIAEDDLDICRYAMDTFILASSVFDPEEAGMMKKSGAAEHPVFGGVEKMAKEDSAFLKEQFGKDDAILEKFKIGELIAPTEFEKPLLNPILEKEYALHEIEGEKHRYAMAHDAKGEEILFKEVDVHGSKQLEFVAGNEALASQYRITEDGNHIIHEEGILKGDLSEEQINSKLQALTQEKAKLGHQLEYSINRVAELSVIKDSLSDAIEIANKHANGHPEPAKIQGYVSELQTTFKETSERISLWQKAKQQAASKLNFNANYVAFLKQALADKTSLQTLNNEINAAHIEVKDALAELNAAKEALEKAKRDGSDLSKLSAVKEVKETEYNDALARLERTIDQGQQLKKAIARQHIEEIQKSADERANALVEEHKRCRRSNEACVAAANDGERKAVDEGFWQKIVASLNEEAFKTQFAHYLQSDFVLDTTIEESANAVILDSPAKLKLEFEALFRRRIDVKRKVILHNAERVLKLENGLKTITDAQQIEMVKSEIAQLEQSTKQAFKDAFSHDIAAHKEVLSMDLYDLPKSEVSRLIASAKAERATLTESSSNLALDDVFQESNQERINTFIREMEEANNSHVDDLTFNAQQLLHSGMLAEIVEELSSSNMEGVNPEALLKAKIDSPKKFYALKEAATSNEAKITKIDIHQKICDLIVSEKKYQVDKSKSVYMKKYKTTVALNAYFKEFAKKTLEHKSFVEIVGSPKENEFMPEWETMQKMAKWAKNKETIMRTKERVDGHKRQFLNKLNELSITPEQVNERLNIYLKEEGEYTLSKMIPGAEYQNLPPPKISKPVKVRGSSVSQAQLKINAKSKAILAKVADTIKGEHLVEAATTEFVNNMPNYPAKYFASRLALSGRNLLLSLVELKKSMLDSMKALRDGERNGAMGSDLFWSENSEIREHLIAISERSVEMQKLEGIFSAQKQNEMPIGTSKETLTTWENAAQSKINALNQKMGEVQTDFTHLLATSGFTQKQLEKSLVELMEQSSTRKIISDSIANYEENVNVGEGVSIKEAFPHIKGVDALGLEAGKALGDIYQRITGEKQAPINVDFIKALSTPESKYYHCKLGLAERQFLLSLQELRYALQDAVIRESSMLETPSSSDVFWQQNQEIRKKAESVGNDGIAYEKALNVIAKGKDNVAPSDMDIRQVTFWVSGRYKTFASLDKKIASHEAQLDAQLSKPGLNTADIKQRVDALLRSSEMANALLDAFEKDPEYSGSSSQNSANNQDAHSSANSPEAVSAFDNIYQRIAGEKKAPISTESIKALTTLESKYHHCRVGLAERELLLSLQELRYDIQAAIINEKSMPAGSASASSEEFWQQNPEIGKKVASVGNNGILYEKLVNVIKKGEDEVAPRDMSEKQVYNWIRARYKTFALLDKKIADREAQLEAQLRKAELSSNDIKQRFDELLQSSAVRDILLDVFQQDPEYSSSVSQSHASNQDVEPSGTQWGVIAKQSPLNRPITVDLEMTQEGMQTFKELFSKITCYHDEFKISHESLVDLKENSVAKYYYSNAALAERRFLFLLEDIKLDMLNALALEKDIHAVSSESFWSEKPALRKKFKESISVGIYCEKTMRIIAESNDHIAPPSLTEQQITGFASQNSAQVLASSTELEEMHAKFQARVRELGFHLPEISPAIERLLKSSETAGMMLEMLLKEPEYSQPIEPLAQSSIEHPQPFTNTDPLFSLSSRSLEEILLSMDIGLSEQGNDVLHNRANPANDGSEQNRQNQPTGSDLSAELAEKLRLLRRKMRLGSEKKALKAANEQKINEIKGSFARIRLDQNTALGRLKLDIAKAQNLAEKKVLQRLQEKLKQAEFETVRTKLQEIKCIEEVFKLEESKLEISDDLALDAQLVQAKEAAENAKQKAFAARRIELGILKEQASAARIKEAQSWQGGAADLADRELGHEPLDLSIEDAQLSQKRKQGAENDPSNIAAKQPRLNQELDDELFGLLATFDVPEGLQNDFLDEDEFNLLFYDAVANGSPITDFSLLLGGDDVLDPFLSLDSNQQSPPRFKRASKNRVKDEIKQKSSINFG